MNTRRVAERAFWFLAGVVVTLVVICTIAVIDLQSQKTIPLLRNWKYEYGDITLSVRQLGSDQVPQTFKADQLLTVYQDGSQRFTVFMDRSGNTTVLSLNGHEWPLLDWQKDLGARITERIRYGGREGETYYDLDCDGQYDMKFVVKNNEIENRYILVGGDWTQVDKGDFRQGRAVLDLALFQFESGVGWMELNREGENG